jgi:HAD superfamily hydrolase (TIGR01549 family)
MIFIFDLDQTLIDSNSLEIYRKNRDWKNVYNLIDQDYVQIFENIDFVLKDLKLNNYKTAIVTSSPSTYAMKIINKFNWKFDTIICYHDTTRRKPHPDPILRALNNLNISHDNYKDVYSFGDRDIDINASNLAGVKSVACYWGAEDKLALKNSKPNYEIFEPMDILKFK